MTARDSLIGLLAPQIGEARAMKLLDDFIVTASVGRMSRDKHRAEVLREAIVAARSEYLHDDTGTPEDEAYNRGVNDAVVAIRDLPNAAVSGSTAGDEQPEVERQLASLAVNAANALRDERRHHQIAAEEVGRLRAELERAEAERDQHRAAAEKAEAKLRKIEHGCETPESHGYGCSCDAAVSGSTAGDEQPETTPWQQAVDGLNALVDADIPVHIEPDGHIANPCGGEHIEWNRETNRWQLVMDEEAE